MSTRVEVDRREHLIAENLRAFVSFVGEDTAGNDALSVDDHIKSRTAIDSLTSAAMGESTELGSTAALTGDVSGEVLRCSDLFRSTERLTLRNDFVDSQQFTTPTTMRYGPLSCGRTSTFTRA